MSLAERINELDELKRALANLGSTKAPGSEYAVYAWSWANQIVAAAQKGHVLKRRDLRNVMGNLKHALGKDHSVVQLFEKIVRLAHDVQGEKSDPLMEIPVYATPLSTAGVSSSPPKPWNAVTMVAVSIVFLVTGVLLGAMVGSVQFGIEHFLNWQFGTTFLMQVSAAAMLGTISGGMLLTSAVGWLLAPGDNVEAPYFCGFCGGLLGALVGGLSGFFGWTDVILSHGRDFHLPSILDRSFGVHWPDFWERTAGSAASVMLVLSLCCLTGLAAIWPYRAGTRFGRLFRCLIVFVPAASGLFWLLTRT